MERQLTNWSVVETDKRQIIPCKMCGKEYKQPYENYSVYCVRCKTDTYPRYENSYLKKQKQAVFKPCRDCGRMIREFGGKFYCTDCSVYTVPTKPSNDSTYMKLKREQEHLDMEKEHDLRENPFIQTHDDMERHEHAMQVRELDELDKRDNDGFWNYEESNQDTKFVDNDYFDREYPTERNDMGSIFRAHKENKFWKKSPYEDGVEFDPHFDDRYGQHNPNHSSEVEIDKKIMEKAIRESMGDNIDDEDLQRALRESKDMYLDNNVEKDNIFAEDVGNDADNETENWENWNDNSNNSVDTNYFYNCYLNKDFQLQPDDSGGETDDTNDTNELINLL